MGFIFTSSNKYRKEISLSGERELKATLEAGFAKLNISRGRSASLFNADITTEQTNDLSRFIEYSVRDNIGYLNLTTDEKTNKKHGSFHISSFESSTWNTLFTDAVPISFDIELGLGEGDFDFTGLSVKDLNLSAGASKVKLRFDKPNKSTIEDLNIEAGLSKFECKGLSNANFNHMKFEGGVGTYTLDFTGALTKEADVDIEVGLGSLTIILPENIGAKVLYEKNIMSHLDIDKDFTEQKENSYYTSNYYSAVGKINLHIDAGLGGVKIRRER
jgi:hypothetical protein